MQVIIVVMLYTCVKSSSPSGQNTKHVYFQIDEFIKQLVTSDKFEELANIIAEKAALKIINSGNITSNLRVSTPLVKTIPSQERTFKRDSFEKTESKLYQRQKLTKSRSLGKINAQAFLKKHLSSRELELNFKHLTQELKKQKSYPGNARNKYKEHSEKENYGKKGKKYPETTKERISIETEENYADNYSSADEEQNKKNAIIEKKVLKLSSVGLKNTTISSDVSKDIKSNKNKVRIENGQMYTYNSSPDYAEYHEKLSNKLKPKRGL